MSVLSPRVGTEPSVWTRSMASTACVYLAGQVRNIYSGPCILRPPIEAATYGLKLKVVLKWKDIYIGNIKFGSLVDGLEMEGFAEWRGLKLQGALHRGPPP